MRNTDKNERTLKERDHAWKKIQAMVPEPQQTMLQNNPNACKVLKWVFDQGFAEGGMAACRMIIGTAGQFGDPETGKEFQS